MSHGIAKGLQFLAHGKFKRVWAGIHIRAYRLVWEIIFKLIKPSHISGLPSPAGTLKVETEHPIAFKSPDHIVPHGTARDNSTNKKFVCYMDKLLHRQSQESALRAMDLGCSGGQMVVDFLKLGWTAVGIEGSDFSLKHRRANWKEYAHKNLFTADITKPFQVKLADRPCSFHLITAWEVLEHIAENDLPALFQDIEAHLEPGGYFIASTTATPDVQNGIELHQTKWENARWREYLSKNFPDLEYVDLGLKPYQYVRCNFDAPSFLTYRKRKN